jgi:hypothetical protein
VWWGGDEQVIPGYQFVFAEMVWKSGDLTGLQNTWQINT